MNAAVVELLDGLPVVKVFDRNATARRCGCLLTQPALCWSRSTFMAATGAHRLVTTGLRRGQRQKRAFLPRLLLRREFRIKRELWATHFLAFGDQIKQLALVLQSASPFADTSPCLLG